MAAQGGDQAEVRMASAEESSRRVKH
jgi:hypothetical protein